MQQKTESHRHCGWSRLEIAVIALVTVFVAAMVFVPSRSSGSGTFMLRVSFPGEETPSRAMRFALIRQQFADIILTHHPHPEVRWEPVITEADVNRVVSISVDSKVYLWGTRSTKVTMIADAVAVEYSIPGEPAIFRVIPFERPADSDLVKVNIPHEPPNDADAWQPKEPIESAGR